LPENEEIPARSKAKIDSEKCQISRVWGVDGMESFFALPKGAKCNTDNSAKAVVPDLQTNICNSGRRKTVKAISLHLDKAAAQNSRRSAEGIEKLWFTECPIRVIAPILPHRTSSSSEC
jgi:hypothetical protein